VVKIGAICVVHSLSILPCILSGPDALWIFIFFFHNLTLGYMTKTLNHIIFFFLHQSQNIFFSNIGNQNIFLEKNRSLYMYHLQTFRTCCNKQCGQFGCFYLMIWPGLEWMTLVVFHKNGMIWTRAEDRIIYYCILDVSWLKECTTQIAPILTTLFSLSLKTGKIPDDWRYASVWDVYVTLCRKP
jgi:hypothetical protein